MSDRAVVRAAADSAIAGDVEDVASSADKLQHDDRYDATAGMATGDDSRVNDDRVNPQDDVSVKSSIAPTAAPAADFAVKVHDGGEDGNEDEEGGGAGDLASPSREEVGFDEREGSGPAPKEMIASNAAPTSTTGDSPPRQHRLRRKRPRAARTARMATIVDGDLTHHEEDKLTEEPGLRLVTAGVALPANHYECTLYRRAVRKPTSEQSAVDANAASATTSDVEGEAGQVGDVSLGMKLTVIGGKVIVQQLNPLEDGRASPAQLAGVIQRGDVLLSINDVSLLNLPIDQLMRGLSPLSTPDSNGSFQRVLKLRLASKEGLQLLNRSLDAPARLAPIATRQNVDGAVDMFSLFPMVDQLSGMPLFEEEPHHALEANEKSENEAPRPAPVDEVTTAKVVQSKISLDEQISSDVAYNRQKEKARFVSEYFAWRDDAFAEVLRGPEGTETRATDDARQDDSSDVAPLSALTLNQFIERGRRAVMGAKALSDKVEALDRGRDSRSLKSWKSTISLYSRASARRRAMQAFDTASVPVNFGRLEEEDDDDEEEEEGMDELSSDGSHSDQGEALDADAQLLRHAAKDAVWRQQVIEYIRKVTEEREKGEDLPEHAEVSDVPGPEGTIDAALSTELGSFLFGDKMSKIITKQKKSLALPPDEITALLFDLATKLNATIPEEVATGSQGSRHSSITPYMGNGKIAPTPSQDVQVASGFLLDEALPVWLKSFKPLPWDQRRILWPLDKPTYGGSTTASSTFSDDSFTQESVGVASHLFSGGTPKMTKRSKNLRERIEDMELNAESRAETCFLATHYFTQKLLPVSKRQLAEIQTHNQDDCIEFVRTYGSYLKLHSCLVHAAAAQAENVLSVLLELARYDPRHKELMRLSLKPNMLVFYEQTMLSSILERLQSLKNEFAAETWLATIDLCAASYPDVQSWQVRSVCIDHGYETRKKEFEDLYYVYLSQLLHPMDGHDAARRNRDLVREWCSLSIRSVDHGTFKDRSPDRRRNFFCVASRTSSAHLLYSRDLASLLQLSKELGDSDLELDIVGELLEHGNGGHDELDSQRESIRSALDHLRTLVNGALDSFEDRDASIPSVRKLKRTLRIYQSASRSCLDELYVPRELLRWIRQMSKIGGRRRTLMLVRFLADEANPIHVLEATHAWTAAAGGGHGRSTLAGSFEIELLPVLQTTLVRAAVSIGAHDEFSGVLSKLRHSRQRLLHVGDEEIYDDSVETMRSEVLPSRNIWARMKTGMLPVLK